MDAHYLFPPAGAYPLNRALFRLKSDDGFRARFREAPEAALADANLDAETRAALVAFDRDRLRALGAHRYLIFMAGLRLQMDRDPSALEYF